MGKGESGFLRINFGRLTYEKEECSRVVYFKYASH